MIKLEYFDLYTQKLGWKVTPVSSDTKSPILKEWNKAYNREEVRSHFELNSTLNLGLCLGEIVDVEADTVGANKTLDDLVKDVYHPTWRSKRSTHHLFLSPDPTLTKLSIQGIEFRGRLHQSLLPPSKVGDVQYRWISNCLKPPLMPKSLLGFYWRFIRKFIRPDAGRGRMNTAYCAICGKDWKIPAKRFGLENGAFNRLEQSWQCRECRSTDLRPAIKRLKR